MGALTATSSSFLKAQKLHEDVIMYGLGLPTRPGIYKTPNNFRPRDEPQPIRGHELRINFRLNVFH